MARSGERESLAEGGDQVLEMGAGGLERASSRGASRGWPGSGRGALPGSRSWQQRGPGSPPRAGGLAVEPDEFGDVDAGRQLDQPLLEPQEQVLDLGGLRPGLLGGDLADGDEVLLAAVPENHPVGAVTFLETGHGSTPMPPQRCCQIVAKCPRAQE